MAAHTHKDDEIIFVGIDSVAKIFSKSRIELLMAIIKNSPHSIYKLAKITNRDFKNVRNDVKLLCDIGLIELKESGNARHGLIPVPLFSGIELDWAA
ncbi:MAG: hypothetical protein A2X86_04060 [Bdellovibrionales bacterium GWA2_49_15]|nr:MAG: hypothetical protein A2X86_04060 [Bdellovibrionales bacterium GWA2_49_15]HAZ12818.1 hypothetical protein [Bdellovibrionales bacterium]